MRIVIAALCVSASAAIWAQDANQPDVFFHADPPVAGVIGVAPQAATIQFLATAPGPEEKLVTNAPFTAEGVTEFHQTLADGTRISRTNSSKTARDSEGRTRREMTVGQLGAISDGSVTHKLVTIVDPVASKSIQLMEDSKTAVVVNLPPTGAAAGGMAWRSESGVAVARARIEKNITMERGAVTTSGPNQVFVRSSADVDVKEEDLGTQTIEGVLAQGKRTTSTIPAGQIGNDRPIEIVSERWYSPDLQLIVKSSVNDPQNGETLYRLTDIRRIEPDPSLFQVPPGYMTREAPGPTIQIRRKADVK